LWTPSPIDMYYDKPEAFFAAIVAAATKAKTEPFVILSTSRTQAEVIHKHCPEACPDAVIKKYNLDSLAANNMVGDACKKSQGDHVYKILCWRP